MSATVLSALVMGLGTLGAMAQSRRAMTLDDAIDLVQLSAPDADTSAAKKPTDQ